MAVGHRVVHGGPDYDRPVLIDHGVVARLERFVGLAPLHQPHNLAPIRSLLANFPTLPQVACFDTAFHRTHGAVADHYAIPHQLHAEGVRRYGFHGLSYEYIAKSLSQIAPDIAKSRVIVAHLGSGASMCALKDGRSVESTMGFTALDGLPMGTRPGQIDPGVVLYLISEKGMSASNVQNFLYRDCGLKGLSGVSNDMRELEASADPTRSWRSTISCTGSVSTPACLRRRCRAWTLLSLRPVSAKTRLEFGQVSSNQLGWLGLALDPAENSRHARLISRSDSRIPVYVVPTDEELMIAQHTLSLLLNRPSPNPRHERVS